MAQIIYSERVLLHLARLFEFLAKEHPVSGVDAFAAIRSAVEVLADHPMIGRGGEAGLRELVISFGRTGYIALYWFSPERDEVQILSVRHQRELDYPA